MINITATENDFKKIKIAEFMGVSVYPVTLI